MIPTMFLLCAEVLNIGHMEASGYRVLITRHPPRNIMRLEPL